MKEIIKMYVHEGDFGASTSATLFAEDRVVVKAEDTSSYETNWAWDRWEPGFLASLVGKTVPEIIEIANGYFNDFEDDYRQPFVNVTVVDANSFWFDE